MKIEVCCGSYIDALEAYKGGADRVELCSDLFFGGLTPSLGAFLMTRENTKLEIAVMIRPREGGFCYNDDEFELMLRDAEIFIQNGADAIVFGFLKEDKTIDYDKCEKFCSVVNGRCKTVFHKAFDVSKSPLIESAIKLKQIGITRILTAGKEKTALEGSNNIKKIIEIGGIEILPAGNIRIHNIKELHDKINCTWVHTSAFEKSIDYSANHDSIHFTSTTLPLQGEYKKANSKIIKEIVEYGGNL
ncbi:copper homeostasis protein CutC [Sedimentibacter sp. zth1]|uniref:copper homeostasis protein CutC n=1 Tax=Sedimentibacter sp. zth1 TaxID=2816908 RepID=UPI001A91D40C|nr:copper homeostasis protein CutC [Sedimentibacter sp. zth1]QSX05374.1 copper homeostasis protein CutC [Sedimentibacter sp. zth1]